MRARHDHAPYRMMDAGPPSFLVAPAHRDDPPSVLTINIAGASTMAMMSASAKRKKIEQVAHYAHDGKCTL